MPMGSVSETRQERRARERGQRKGRNIEQPSQDHTNTSQKRGVMPFVL